MSEKRIKLLQWIVWLIRLSVGGVFIFSGLVKGIDPWGTLFKFEEYASALHINAWHNLTLSGVFALSGLEFVTGVFILTGSFRRSSPWLATAIMIVMLPLSFWLLIKNPISDCGCFGDAIKLSNAGTFIKNIFLLAGSVFLIPFNRLSPALITPALQWIGLLVSALFILLLETIGYTYQPLIDFRPYKLGTPLIDNSLRETETEYKFIYQKGDSIRVVGENDEIPSEDEGWNFIKREEGEIRDINLSDNSDYNNKNLRIWDPSGEIDETDNAISEEGRQIIVLSPDLSHVSLSTTWKINALNDWAKEKGIDFIAIVSGTENDIENWEDISMAEYEIFIADDTEIKKIVRGNPAVIFLQDGKIIYKSSLSALNFESLENARNEKEIEATFIDNEALFENLVVIYLILMLCLVGSRLIQFLIIRLKENRHLKSNSVTIKDNPKEVGLNHDDKGGRE